MASLLFYHVSAPVSAPSVSGEDLEQAVSADVSRVWSDHGKLCSTAEDARQDEMD